MNKREIRKKILAVRDAIPVADRTLYDKKIREIVTGMEEYRETEVILAYVSYKSEVDTMMLIRQVLEDGKNVFAPKVSGNEMEFWQISSLEDLREGYRGILEPEQSFSFMDWVKKRCSTVSTDTVAGKAEEYAQEVCKVMMWMPGAVFDKERHRIGYGGGFYDRYLSRLLQLLKQTASTKQPMPHSERFTLTTAALAYSCQVLERILYEEHDVKPDMLITEQGITIKEKM
ncbi:MAG: 5-formyltetrahydrofolate cyclo-ligase [Lachnospiraceae bacterium]|nr:5-formyltetrahydrofolate cyclo-ligase [Lachnospiraceae bacterium]